MSNEIAETFKVLAGPTRIKVIDLLKRRGPLCVNDISETLGMTASAISQHLNILKNAGLVRKERKGYWVYYDVDPVALEQCNEVLAQICNCGCRGSCRLEQSESADAEDELSLLRKREQELEEELHRVRARIRVKEEGG